MGNAYSANAHAVLAGSHQVMAAKAQPKREAGIRLIIAYKVAKAAAWIVLAATLVVLISAGQGPHLHDVAAALRHHVAGVWSMRLADLVVSAAEPHHLWLIVGALLLDGLVSLLEGWALWRGHWWGPWLVVVATSALLPFEVDALVKHFHLGRVGILAVNLLVVVYLARRALKRRSFS